MLLKRKIYYIFILALGFLAYGVSDWATSLYTVFNYRRLQTLEEIALNNGSWEDYHPKGVVNHDEHSSKNGTNTKEIDDKIKNSEVDNVVSIISRLSKFEESHEVMLIVRSALNNLSHVPSLPRNSADKYESSSLTTVVPPEARVTYSDSWDGYNLPIITCNPEGRLGNVMTQYASLYAIQKYYNVTALRNDYWTGRLSAFPFLSMPQLPGKYNRTDTEWIKIPRYDIRKDRFNYTPIEFAAAGLLGPHRFAMKGTANEIHLYAKFQKELQQEFTFTSKITTEVQNYLKRIAENRSSAGHPDTVFIGFHVRRTDYAQFCMRKFGAKLPEELYFNRAMDYFRNKFPGRVVFIAASDGRNYLKMKIGNNTDVFFAPGRSAPLDLATLISCNHSIITLGTYGFMSGFLAGGEVVYPDVKFARKYRMSRVTYERIGLTYFTPLPVD